MDRLKADIERKAFLKALDKSDVDVSDWEAKFIESCTDRSFYTEGHRSVIDRMIDRYGSRIKW